MKWLKMRTCHASGYSKWEYKALYVEKINKEIEKCVEEIVKARNDEYSWSDKYRGVEYFIINTRQVPNSKILKTCEDLERSIEYAKESIVEDTGYLIEIRNLEGKGRKTDPDEIERAKRDKRYKLAMEKIKKERAKQHI